jgi:type I restriction enzyme S subunit
MKRYPAYKESGIEWLGEIPESWDKKKIKHLGRVVLGKMLTPVDKGGYFEKPYLRAQNILWERVDTNDVKTMWFSEKELSQYRLSLNDLLVSEGGEVGRTAIWQNELDECYIQNSVHKLTVDGQMNPKYILYLLMTFGKRGHFDAIVNRVSIGHLTKEKLQDVEALSPPKNEQDRIAKYLDHKTHLIDTLIEKKQKQIELVQEQRAAIINQAVTKGLNPNIKMKDSGIEWLGEVPRHWKVTQLKHFVKAIETGPFGSQLHANEYVDNGIPVLNPANIINGQIKPYWSCSVSSDTSNRLKRHKLRAGDILFARRGEMGRAAEVLDEQEGWICGTGCIKVRPNQLILNSSFLASYLSISGVKDWLSLESVGSTMENLNSIIISEIPVVLPPINEQNSIINHIKKTSKQIDKSINKIQKLCDKLKECRTTLISEVVTGKIDVRDEAIS